MEILTALIIHLKQNSTEYPSNIYLLERSFNKYLNERSKKTIRNVNKWCIYYCAKGELYKILEDNSQSIYFSLLKMTRI